MFNEIECFGFENIVQSLSLINNSFCFLNPLSYSNNRIALSEWQKVIQKGRDEWIFFHKIWILFLNELNNRLHWFVVFNRTKCSISAIFYRQLSSISVKRSVFVCACVAFGAKRKAMTTTNWYFVVNNAHRRIEKNFLEKPSNQCRGLWHKQTFWWPNVNVVEISGKLWIRFSRSYENMREWEWKTIFFCRWMNPIGIISICMRRISSFDLAILRYFGRPSISLWKKYFFNRKPNSKSQTLLAKTTRYERRWQWHMVETIENETISFDVSRMNESGGNT